MAIGPQKPLGSTLPPQDSDAYPRDVEFHVLGPVEALKDGVSVRLGGPKQRTVLALLLAEAGRTVSADRLIDLVWGDEPTSGARSTLQTYISNLRSEIGELVARDGGGYRLDVERDQVDAFRFEDEVTRARGRKGSQPLEAAQRLRDALALWQGHPYADIAGSVVLDQEARRLEELRLTAIEERLEAELALGNHAELVGELEVLTAEHPFRERFRALHMLSLYRSGRQAEALHAYRKTRTFLAEELGIDPSPDLRDLEAKILGQDPSLVLETEPRVERLVFLLADTEDSTVLWELHPRDMGPAAGEYDRIIAETVEAAGGRVVKRVGDGLDAVFSDVGSAVAAAQEAQRALASAEWGPTGPLRARMAIDVGDVEARGRDYFGPVLNRCGRILASGHGGQVLLSADAHAALSGSEAGWGVRALGEFRFKGLGRPQQVFQLLVDGLPSEFPSLRIDRPLPFPRTSFERTVRGYELREQVGGGEFGVVHRAYQPSVGREVAIKVIRPEFVNQPAFVRRFESEAQLVAQLEHPYIVALYDYWRDPEGAYLVMRWLRGGALKDALDRGPWNVEPASRLLQQIGSALAYAHRQGALHRDLKPANVLLDEEGNAYLSDFAVASRLVDASEAGRPITSSPAYVPPEELRGEPLRPAADIFALGLLTFELLTGRRPPMDRSLPAIHDLRPDLPTGIGSVIARATADDPSARFASVNEFLGAFFGSIGEAPPSEELPFTPTRNPFKGLHAFSELDAQDFFGRATLTEELLNAINEHRLVAVVGPSGIGKSSVVRAGLIPALRAGALPGTREWVITEMFPGSYPFEELEAALLRVAVERPEGLTEDLARDERGILRVTKRILPPDSQALLLVDQFEELFTLTTDEETRRLFLDALTTLALDERSRVRVVITLRADFFDRPLRYPRFGEQLREGMVAVAAPDEADLAEAITRPGQGVGVRFEPGLVSRIIADVNDQPGALPLLQYALTELFAARTSDLLAIHGYQASGGVLGALGRRAEELYQGLDTLGRHAVRQVFLRLVAVSDVAGDTRRRVRRQELNGLAVDPEVLNEVIRRFGEYRLLSFDRDPLTRGPTVEVAHEALLSEWERLRKWTSERREDLLLERRLSEAVEEWDRAGRDPSYLLTGARLHQFATWAKTTDLALTAAERDYIRQAREADAVRRLRVRRRRRSILGGFVAAAFVSLALAGVAHLNQLHARESAELARSHARIASARELAASSVANLDVDPERSILLALAAVDATWKADRTVVPDAEEALHRALQESRVVLTVPQGRAIAVSSDGERFATTGEDGTATVWETDTGKRLLTLGGHKGEVNGIAFSPDGSLLATAGDDRTVRLWDGASGRQIYVLRGHRDLVLGAAFSPDGSLLATSSQDGTVRIWDVAAGTQRLVLRGPPGEKFSNFSGLTPAFSPDGSRVASGGWFSTPIWDLATGKISMLLPRQRWEALAVAFSPDGTRIATDKHLDAQTWDAETGEPLTTFSGHTGDILSIAYSPDGTRIATGGDDGTAQVWDAATGKSLLTLAGHTIAVDQVAFTPDGDRLLTGGADGTARLWDISPTGGRDWLTVPGPQRQGGVSFSPDGRSFAVPGQVTGVAIRDVETGAKIITLRGHNATIRRMAFSPDGTRLAGADGSGPENPQANRTVPVWDVTTGELVMTLAGHADQVSAVAFSPDGRRLATGSWDGTVRLWDALSGKELRAVDAGGPVFALAFSPDGRFLVSGDDNHKSLVVWDADSLERVGELRGHTDVIQDVAFAPTGEVVTASWDGTAKVWDLASRRELATLRGHTGALLGVAVSPDGTLVATASLDGTAKLWDLATGREVLTLFDGGPVNTVAFSPDGRFLAVGSGNGRVALHLLPIDELRKLARERVTRTLTDEECRQYLHVGSCPGRT